MRRNLAILFLLLIFVTFIWLTFKAIHSWIAVSSGPNVVVFDGRDTKLMLAWLVIGSAAVYFAVWPQALSTKKGGAKPTTWKQAFVIGLTITGILSLQQVIFAGGYLAKAEEYARNRGYQVVCNEIGYKYGRELIMAKSRAACEADQRS